MKEQTYDIMCRFAWGEASHEDELWTLYRKEVMLPENSDVFPTHGLIDKLIEIGLFKKSDKIRIAGGNVFLLRFSNNYPVVRLIKKNYGWVQYGHDWKQFVVDGLNTAGTEIEVRSSQGKNWSIIGHINQAGDDSGHLSPSIPEDAIITRYRDLKQSDYIVETE